MNWTSIISRKKLFDTHFAFYKKKALQENEPQKPKILKRILKKSPASNAWAEIF